MTEERCRCGFPLDKDQQLCIACLPPQFRQVIGRYDLSIYESIITNPSTS